MEAWVSHSGYYFVYISAYQDEDMSDEPVGENEDVEDGDFMQDSDSDGEWCQAGIAALAQDMNTLYNYKLLCFCAVFDVLFIVMGLRHRMVCSQYMAFP